MRRLGTSDKLLLSVAAGFRGGATQSFYKCALRLQVNPLSEYQHTSFLDRIGYVLYDIVH